MSRLWKERVQAYLRSKESNEEAEEEDFFEGEVVEREWEEFPGEQLQSRKIVHLGSRSVFPCR